jgi:hypothetical protein
LENPQDLDRLNRIEDKIDKLADYMIAIARAEEKLISLEISRHSIDKTLADQGDAIAAMTLITTSNLATITLLKKVFWIVISALITGAIGTVIAMQTVETVT